MAFLMTVQGPIDAARAGFILPHEHLVVDFSGEDVPGTLRFHEDQASSVILPHLDEAKRRGVTTLFECTPAYLGRTPSFLRRLSKQSGMHVVTNTGYYGAAQDKFLPRVVWELSPEQIAFRWIQEWKQGIGDSNVFPGFIKIGVDPGRLSEVDERLVRAAALTCRATGLTIASHTTDRLSMEHQIALLIEEGVSSNRFVWVHAQSVRDTQFLVDVARRGVWLEFDGIQESTVEEHVSLVRDIRDAGLLDRVLLSHDAGWYSVGEPNGGTFRGFTTLIEKVLPALRQIGFHEEALQQLCRTNPARAFAIDAAPPLGVPA